ncbi:hypothetical protein RHSIM_Rhsim05G0009900 [Rhododendron simsii]|uniref:Agglutinin domain-containing protein n=1 Tax=Rhododendron simsii TaxID=118357 RepID=A0A834GW58_RHOSS|nr:hypothetical protein RHSIM_Rhsim05G0009900 [Rhododendron simsii]
MVLLPLPRFVAIQSKFQTYLHYMHKGVGLHGFLEFTGEEIASPYAKFEIEGAKCTAGNDNGFVHIRCCYNNKYWVAKSSSDSFIVARADEPNEDQSQWSCTLFEPIRVDCKEGSGSTNTTVQFRHVQLGQYLTRTCLIAQSLSTDSDRHDVFGIIDWGSMLILPKHIAFKGDNGLYLSARLRNDGYNYLEFASRDNGDPTVGNEVFITKDGRVRIKNNHFDKFWMRSIDWNWIWAYSDDSTTDNLNTLFTPVKVGDNVIALRNLGSNNFCMRMISIEGKDNCLYAGVETLSKEARLEVEELVISREIYNVIFHLMDARIYNQNKITMATKIVTNDTQESNTAKLKFLRKETKSSTWNVIASFKLGVKTEIQTGIPFIVEGRVEVSAEFSGGYKWGETMSTENQVDTEYTIPVPPMSKVTVSLLATQGSCNVPYSYTQRDTLMNGKTDILHFDDGVYTGVNSFQFKYDITTEKL